jgi:uncharacterized protein with GYD domain
MFLVQGRYTAEGLKGLMKDGGSGRKAAVEKAAAALGGRVESFYYALGKTDVYVIVEFPDAIVASSLAMAVNSTGVVSVTTTPLMTPADVDAAIAKKTSYRAPGTA